MIDRLRWIDSDKLAQFILRCQVNIDLLPLLKLEPNYAQDPKQGGIADRPGDMVDVFHTVFGIAGLSLLSFPGLEAVDPI